MPMIIIEGARIPLPCPAVVHDNKLPAPSFHWRTADRFDYRPCKIARCGGTAPGPRPKTSARWRGGRRLQTLLLLDAGFFDYNLCSLFHRTSAWNF
jgi:hypothetical protein